MIRDPLLVDAESSIRTHQLLRRLAIGALLAVGQYLVFVHSAAGNSSTGTPIFTSSVAPASTLLPSGEVLTSGGAEQGKKSSAALSIQAAIDKKTALLPFGLNRARKDHSATLLPSGSVLIHGGRDELDRLISQSELIDLAEGHAQVIRPTGLVERYQHIALVLEDGSVLMLGGYGTDGKPVSAIERYRPDEMSAESSNASVPPGHTLRSGYLTPDGNALLVGNSVSQQEVAFFYNVATDSLRILSMDERHKLIASIDNAGDLPSISGSNPADKAGDVAIDKPVVLRFSEPMNVTTTSASTITLLGPDGEVEAKVVPVDDGAMVFITPLQQLLPATSYSVFVKGARNGAGREMPLKAMSFQTASLSFDRAFGKDAALQGATANASAESEEPALKSQLAVAAQSQQPLKEGGSQDDEAWVPSATDRKGDWLSKRGHLASLHLPKHEALRRTILSRILPQQALASELRARTSSKEVIVGSWLDSLETGSEERRLTDAGDTSLAGHLLRLNGLPLANATVSIGNVSAKTDTNGEFLLRSVQSGEQVLVIDGRSASSGRAVYGRFEYRHLVEAGRENVLPFTVWMPKLDTKHAVRIESPTRRETVISNPSMPGLEVVLPAGTVIRDTEGKIVNTVTLTPIPVDQPPYPMPYAGVPLSYTLQPGGATIHGPDGKPGGAIVRYPNYTLFGPGAPIQLFDYDPKGRGWYVYSAAEVSSSGSSIHSDRDFVIYQFATTSYSAGGPPPPPDCPCEPSVAAVGEGSSDEANDPISIVPINYVDPINGSARHVVQDVYIDDVIPIKITRTYRSGGSTNGITPLIKAFGTDMAGMYEGYLIFSADKRTVQMVMGDGLTINFRTANPAPNIHSSVYIASDSRGQFRNATVRYSMPLFGSGSNIVVTLANGRKWGFSVLSARLAWIEDRLGNRMTFSRPSSVSYVNRITSPHGRYVDILYNSAGLVGSVTDNIGRKVTYTYFPNTKNLQSVTDMSGKVTSYSWDVNNRLHKVTDPDGNVEVENFYESPVTLTSSCNGTTSTMTNVSSGRVSKQVLANGGATEVTYTGAVQMVACGGGQLSIAPSLITQSKNQLGVITKYEHDSSLNLVKQTDAVGLPEQQVTTFEYTNKLLSKRTDALGRSTTITYDDAGNRTKVSRSPAPFPAGSVSVSMTYDPIWNLPLTVTGPLGHTWKYTYDGRGNLHSAESPLGHTSTYTYDDVGRLLSATNPLLKTSRLSYVGPDLAEISDALGRTQRRFTDGAGRVVSMTDALGNVSFQTLDDLIRMTSITDALGGITRFSYNARNKLLTQTDANSHNSQYSYQPSGELQSFTDPLLRSELFSHTATGLLKQYIDRKGQVSGMAYDALGRVKTIGFGATAAAPTAYTSTVALTWDAGNRLTQIVDTQGGVSTTIILEYDQLDRLMKESTDQGEIHYWYDASGRRTMMTLKNGGAGFPIVDQPSLSYTWDAADRLTLVTQAAGPSNGNVAQTVAFEYDDADRLVKTTYTGGTSVNTTYTDAGEVKTLKYLRADGSVIAQGGYTYDLAGRRTGVSGDLANFIGTQEPSITEARYDAANQLLTWGRKTFSYDDNGNMLGDGAATYSWDARDQLSGISSATTIARFHYDSLGRRTARTLGSVTTAYNYDGDNFIQELDGLGRGSNVTANLLTGGIDQHFMRQTYTTNAQGAKVPSLSWVMVEANNSTVVQADGAGNVQKTFQYTPYGSPIATTGTSTDSQRYTGREEDGTGLYYYRARYYRPDGMRFISEDPIGWASGQFNNYAYVGGNPLSFVDPDGLKGHHLVPQSIWRNETLRPETARVFDRATTGPIPDGHNFGDGHSAYNKAVKEMWEKMKKSGVKCPSMTPSQAEDFIRQVRQSQDPRIRDFNHRIYRKIINGAFRRVPVRGNE